MALNGRYVMMDRDSWEVAYQTRSEAQLVATSGLVMADDERDVDIQAIELLTALDAENLAGERTGDLWSKVETLEHGSLSSTHGDQLTVNRWLQCRPVRRGWARMAQQRCSLSCVKRHYARLG